MLKTNLPTPTNIKLLILSALFLLASVLLFYLPYRVVHDSSIDSLNTQQLVLARDASREIQDFFNNYYKMLSYLPEKESIDVVDEDVKKCLDGFFQLHKDEIAAVVWVGAAGSQSYSTPDHADLRFVDVALQEHGRFMDSHEPMVSEVFQDSQGVLYVLFTVPFFVKEAPVTTISVVIPLEVISKKYLTDIVLGNGGYAWMLSKSGVELYCPVPGHIGKTIFETSSQFPSVIAMAQNMMQGGEGATTYDYDRVKGEKTETIRKHAVYTDVMLPGNLWSVVVATPERQALEVLTEFGKWWLLIFGIIVVGFFLYVTLFFLVNREEQKLQEAEQKLLKSEQLFSRFIDNAHIPIVMINVDGTIELLNRKFQELYGYTPQDIPTIEHWFSRAYPDEKLRAEISRAWKRKLEEAMRTGVAVTFRERKITCKDGSNRDVVFAYTLIENRVIITFYDTTEHNALRRAEEALLQRQERTKKMEAIGVMAGGVAHDLNNILSGIVNYPELLLLQLPEESELRKPLTAIQEAGLRAAAVVADLLTIARGVASVKETSNPNVLIQEYLDSPEYQRLKFLHANVVFTTQLDPTLGNISCSTVHIKKCLMNLITNAAEAIDDEGMVVIATAKRFVDESAGRALQVKEGEYAVITVTDTGSGISEEDIHHIFEPFYTKKVMGKSGTGLGLSVVWNTVQDHAGGISVDSGEQGTIFELYFPVTSGEMVAAKKKKAVDDLKGNGERILVVDDERQQRDIASQMLSSLGYSVHAVGSGEEAVAYLKDKAVDLVLLDMIMSPGMNGRQTYDQIREIHPGQKAVVCSGYSQNEDVQHTHELGAGGFLKKPYSLEQLGEAVKKELKQ